MRTHGKHLVMTTHIEDLTNSERIAVTSLRKGLATTEHTGSLTTRIPSQGLMTTTHTGGFTTRILSPGLTTTTHTGGLTMRIPSPVSYTHLTLPTTRMV